MNPHPIILPVLYLKVKLFAQSQWEIFLLFTSQTACRELQHPNFPQVSWEQGEQD